jgi:DNA-binding MarR family transcriptional regulator
VDNFQDDDIVRLRSAVVRISRLLDRQAGDHGITKTQWSILVTVAKRGPVGASELAEREGVNPTMLSRTLTKLEDAGLVRRTTDAGDRRVVRVEATPTGRRLQQKVSAERTRLLAERLARVAAPEAALILAALPALEALAADLAREAVRA